MSKVVSIIIPTYNMEAYLQKCLSSLLIPSLNKIEVLVVNDGSHDRSLEIAQDFAERYPESFIVIDKKNGNYGSCVNIGLATATGQYVKVLDADDSFITENFEQMVGVMEKTDTDLIITDFIKDHVDGEKRHISYKFPANKILNFSDVCHDDDFRTLWMHAVAYKRENLLRIGYHQTEGISYTDQEWVFLPMTTVRTLYYLPLPVYDYLLGREGQTMTGDVYYRNFGQNITCTCTMLDELASLSDISTEMRDVLHRKLYGRIKLIYKNCLVRCKDFDIRELIVLDDKLHTTSEELYRRSDEIRLSRPLFCYRYIRMWRRNHDSRLLRLIISAYRMTKSI
jgi:glycosyltransferase involved in cell wall biosynthesis